MDEDDWGFVGAIALLLAIGGGAGIGIDRLMLHKKADKAAQSSVSVANSSTAGSNVPKNTQSIDSIAAWNSANSVATHLNADSVAKSRDVSSVVSSNNSSSKTYVLDSVDLAKMADSIRTTEAAKIAKASKIVPIMYNGVEVDSLRKYSNAKLIGVYNNDIEFYSGQLHTYFAKGLLFELNNSKLLSVISRDKPYYLGQRYDISYHTFKKGVDISGNSVLTMFLEGKCDAFLDNAPYNDMYDGVLADYKLSKRK